MRIWAEELIQVAAKNSSLQLLGFYRTVSLLAGVIQVVSKNWNSNWDLVTQTGLWGYYEISTDGEGKTKMQDLLQEKLFLCKISRKNLEL